MAKKDRMAKKELRVRDKYVKASGKGKTGKAGRMYDKLVDLQTDNINQGIDVDYDSGTYSYQEGGMTNKDLEDIQTSNLDKNITMSIMQDAYNKRKK